MTQYTVMLRLLIPDRVDEDIFMLLSVVERDYVNLYATKTGARVIAIDL